MPSLERLQFRYEPYPIGLATSIFEEGFYRDLVETFPPEALLAPMPDVGRKWSLSERDAGYHDIVHARPAWQRFYGLIKGADFIKRVLEALRERHIDLGASRSLGARFEFSSMPADGGHILPHTDAEQKIITLVLAMVRPGAWQNAWGGATDINRPRHVRHAFNRRNRQAGFADMGVVDSLPFAPNQAVVFVKTFNSWHSVAPMTGPKGVFRRTVTVNIERPTP